MAVKCYLGMCLLVACACVRLNLSSTAEPPITYLLDPPAAQLWPSPAQATVLVNDFSATPPYDTADMVLVTARGTLVAASRHRWASRLSSAFADLLWCDLVASRAVQAAHRHYVRGPRIVVVDGHLRECGAREVGTQWYAVVDVTVSLSCPDWSLAAHQRNYRIERPLTGEGFDALAAAMIPLTRAWIDSTVADLRRMADAAPVSEVPR